MIRYFRQFRTLPIAAYITNVTFTRAAPNRSMESWFGSSGGGLPGVLTARLGRFLIRQLLVVVLTLPGPNDYRHLSLLSPVPARRVNRAIIPFNRALTLV